MADRRGITQEVWDYTQSPDIAFRYDRDHHGFALFDLDRQILGDVVGTLPAPPDGENRVAVDLGCGTGRTLLSLVAMDFEAIGIDLSPHMIEIARTRLDDEPAARDHVRLFHADITDLSFLDEASADIAVCLYSTFGLISGRENRVAFLRGVRRILRPGGAVLLHGHNRYHGSLQFPHLMWLWQSWRDGRRGEGEFGDAWFDDYLGAIDRMYIHAFSARELRDTLLEAGFGRPSVLPINRDRTAVMTRGWFRNWRANGFFAIGYRPG